MTQMPVSLAMLYEHLSRRLPAVLRANNHKRCIHDVRAYCPSLPMRPDFVYVREGENAVTLIQHESGCIEVQAPLADTLNILMDLFAEFQELHERLQNALLDSNPFQSLAEVAYQALRCPVMITSNVFRILGIAGEDEGIPWEYSKNTGFSPPAYVNYYTHPSRYNAYMNGTQPLLQKLPSYCNWPGVLRVNCFFQGEAACRLVVKLLTTEQSAGFIQMAEQIASVVEQIPDELAKKYFFDQYANNPYVSESGQPLKCKNPLAQRLQTVIGARRYVLCRIRPAEKRTCLLRDL